MKTIVACLLVMVACVAHAQTAPCDRAATTILVVRHADRAGQADSLSMAGVWRSKALAFTAASAGVKAIYHSDTNRTQRTAEPLAKELGLTPIVYPAKEIDALVARIFKEQEGNTVLVVGHSNTVAMIVAAAGGPTIPDLPEDEFDKLFVVTTAPCRRGPASLLTLQYGMPSPSPSETAAKTDAVAPVPSIELPAELARVLTDYEKAWQARDAAGLANLFTEDGFVLSSGGPPVRGRDAIRAKYKDAGGPLSLRALAYSTQDDTGYIIGAYGGAKDKPDDGKFTLTLRKEKGRWLIMSDMDNSNRR